MTDFLCRFRNYCYLCRRKDKNAKKKVAKFINPFTDLRIEAYGSTTENARRMKAKGFPVEDIAEITGLSVEEIESL